MTWLLIHGTIIVVFGCLAPTLESSTVASSQMVHSTALRAEALLNDKTRPPNAEDFPDGYWFGTQSLLCVMGVTGSPSSSGRKRRDVFTSPSRYALRFSHRVVYYRDTLFEWGTGTLGYFIGMAPSVVECDITWEKAPIGNSTCSTQTIKDFTYNYRSQYGVYNLVTNNCHHYVNHIAQLLASPNCVAAPGDWTRFTQSLWHYLGEMLEGSDTEVVHLDDRNDHPDRTTIH